MGICAVLCAALGSAGLLDEGGIRCNTSRGRRVNVSPEQWQKVRDAFQTHDPNKIAPFISERGIMETHVSNMGIPGKPEISVGSELVKKKAFLKGISEVKYVGSGAQTGNPGLDYVFIYLWFSVNTYTDFGNDNKLVVPKSIHRRSDVWVSKSFGGQGRMRFVCEDGWLKVAEIKALIPADP